MPPLVRRPSENALFNSPSQSDVRKLGRRVRRQTVFLRLTCCVALVCYYLSALTTTTHWTTSTVLLENFTGAVEPARKMMMTFPRLQQCAVGGFDNQALHTALEDANMDTYVRYITTRGHEPRAWRHLSAKKYFFAINLHNNEESIPYLFAAVVKSCIFLAANRDQATAARVQNNCFISVYESGSTDSTRLLLKSIEVHLSRLGIPYKFVVDALQRDLDEHRIAFLATIRNEVLAPFYEDVSAWDEVIFLNDIITCASSILELIVQKAHHAAEVVSGMDYVVNAKRGVLFYDTWVNKDIIGQSFNNQQPFVKDEHSWERFKSRKPFQVFTTWAGGIVITASLFQNPKVRFRHSRLLECASCECELLIRDLWHYSGTNGLKVMVVPSVYVAYTVSDFIRVSNELNRIFSRHRRHKTMSSNDSDNTAPTVQFSTLPPETMECCGMEFPGEQLLNFELQTTTIPWRWWYHVADALGTSDASAMSSIFNTAIGTFDRHCPSFAYANVKYDDEREHLPILHFILPTTDPMLMPHLAFAHMLEWVRLNPCFNVRVHEMSSFVALASEGSTDWGDMARDMVDIQDVVLTMCSQGFRRRILGYLILYLYGGIVADVEVLPMTPMSLSWFSSIVSFEAAFDAKSLGEGPYVIAAPARSEPLRQIITLSLQRLNTPAQTVGLAARERWTVFDFTHAPTHEILTRTASMMVGRRLFADVVGNNAAVSSETLSRALDIRGHGRAISSVTHQSITTLFDGDILLDGEMLMSSTAKTYEKILWMSSSLNETVQGHNTAMKIPPNMESHRKESYYVALTSAKRRTESEMGCLEIIAEAHTIEIANPPHRKVLWKQCWPQSRELDMVYLTFEFGSVRVYTSASTSCGGMAMRTILWSTPPVNDHWHATRWCLFRCIVYRVNLSKDGQLRVLAERTRKWRTPRLATTRRNRCLIDAMSAPECSRNALSVVRRQLIRYRDHCPTVH